MDTVYDEVATGRVAKMLSYAARNKKLIKQEACALCGQKFTGDFEFERTFAESCVMDYDRTLLRRTTVRYGFYEGIATNFIVAVNADDTVEYAVPMNIGEPETVEGPSYDAVLNTMHMANRRRSNVMRITAIVGVACLIALTAMAMLLLQ